MKRMKKYVVNPLSKLNQNVSFKFEFLSIKIFFVIGSELYKSKLHYHLVSQKTLCQTSSHSLTF